MIGTNDRNDLSNFISNLQTIYDNAKSAGKEIIFMSSIPASVSEESTHTYHMEDIDNHIMCFANTNNIQYISVYKLFIEYCKYTNTSIDSLLDEGGLHPNDNGYDVMFYLICNALGFGTKRQDATW